MKQSSMILTVCLFGCFTVHTFICVRRRILNSSNFTLLTRPKDEYDGWSLNWKGNGMGMGWNGFWHDWLCLLYRIVSSYAGQDTKECSICSMLFVCRSVSTHSGTLPVCITTFVSLFVREFVTIILCVLCMKNKRKSTMTRTTTTQLCVEFGMVLNSRVESIIMNRERKTHREYRLVSSSKRKNVFTDMKL